METTIVDPREKARESRLRRRLGAERVGLRKSRARESLDNFGGYMLVDLDGNYVVAGARFELTLDDVEEWLKG